MIVFGERVPLDEPVNLHGRLLFALFHFFVFYRLVKWYCLKSYGRFNHFVNHFEYITICFIIF